MANKAFGFKIVDHYYHQHYKDGQWLEPIFSSNPNIDIEMSATSLHYGQQAFDGMKAFKRKDGGINLFRPLENAKRFRMSCRRMMMPEVSDEQFMYAVTETVKRNAKHIPDYDPSMSLYVRAFMIGTGHNLGLRPAPSYFFGVFVAPVGIYFNGDAAGKFLIVDDDRAAPNGTGPYKVGGNYGGALKIQFDAKSQGYEDALFLDPATHQYLDEFGSANLFGIKDNTYYTPKSSSILKSITNDTLKILAKDVLGLNVLETQIPLTDIETFDEMAACGTAASVAPIGSLTYQEKVYHISESIGPVTKKLKQLLLDIQYGNIKDEFGFQFNVTL
ncbi:MAG: branched-chain amino acid aminotransferase [Firmicutes bacterium]|nr:branched-chain amino acid aminotransferase [Bacillota bacterium]